MWVRNQDKTILINSDAFYITENEETETCLIESSTYILGEYSTKKKALKVLNNIERCIRANYTFLDREQIRHYNNSYSAFEMIGHTHFVFQMPPDGDTNEYISNISNCLN